MKGESALWRAVLTQAYEDAESCAPDAEHGSETYECLRARHYLRADGPDDAVDLKLVCDFADLPVNRVYLWARRRYPLAA